MSDHTAEEQAAVTAAAHWLALIDQGDAVESWNQAASLFKALVTQPQWESSLAAAQGPLGKATARTLNNTQYKTELPGAPDGEYVVIEYETAFEHKEQGVETIAMLKDTDSHWRVSGYFVK